MRAIRAEERDLESILTWLEREYNETLGDGFWCNRRVIRRSFEDANLWVIRNNDEAVAFQVGNYAAEIACVRQDFQRQGLGKKLFKAALARAKRANVNVFNQRKSRHVSRGWLNVCVVPAVSISPRRSQSRHAVRRIVHR